MPRKVLGVTMIMTGAGGVVLGLVVAPVPVIIIAVIAALILIAPGR